MIKDFSLYFFLFVSLILWPDLLHAELLPFDETSLKNIENNNKDKAFIMAMWSTECPPCLLEIQWLGEIKAKNPEINLVLISADPISKDKEIRQNLKRYGLDAIDTWAFAHSFREKIIYSIDETWAGELPRSYLYDNKANRTTIKGRIAPSQLIELINPVNGNLSEPE